MQLGGALALATLRACREIINHYRYNMVYAEKDRTVHRSRIGSSTHAECRPTEQGCWISEQPQEARTSGRLALDPGVLDHRANDL